MSARDEYAFPRPLPNVSLPLDDAYATIVRHAGMTLRDYFAGQALGLLADHDGEDYLPPEEIARIAYSLADAMMAAREK